MTSSTFRFGPGAILPLPLLAFGVLAVSTLSQACSSSSTTPTTPTTTGTDAGGANAAAASDAAGDPCTSAMLASISATCSSTAGSMDDYTGFLAFACADTTVDAPDRQSKLDAFCQAHKTNGVGNSGVIADGGAFFECECDNP